MLVAKIVLTLIAILYLALSLWCSFSPESTSQKVGFELIGDTGKCEYLTVYGGLEFGMALVFLLPWLSSSYLRASLLACTLIHGSLVLFRSIGLFLYPNVSAMTYQLAAGEWVVFLLCILLLWSGGQVSDSTHVKQPAQP
jgi:hypothetical protein